MNNSQILLEIAYQINDPKTFLNFIIATSKVGILSLDKLIKEKRQEFKKLIVIEEIFFSGSYFILPNGKKDGPERKTWYGYEPRYLDETSPYKRNVRLKDFKLNFKDDLLHGICEYFGKSEEVIRSCYCENGKIIHIIKNNPKNSWVPSDPISFLECGP